MEISFGASSKGGAPRGGGGAEGGSGAQDVVPEELPPRVRHAFLRLAGPDDPARGTLQPVHALEQVRWLAQGTRPEDVEALVHAVSELRRAAEQLRRAPVPPGTTPLDFCAFHHVYDVDGRHDVPADATWHGVTAMTFSGPARHEHRVVPRESHDVFRFCRMDLPAHLPLPAGPVQVFVDGAFRVNTRLDSTGGTAQLEVNLGVDPDLRVLGRVVNIRQEEKGLVTQQSRVEHDVRLEVLSTLGAPATLLVFDRLPIPDEGEKDIQVLLGTCSPAPEKTDRAPDGTPVRGGLRWTLQLAPRANAKVAFAYTLVLPAKHELVGGNRRE